jgi:hypothetical protein
MVGISEAPGWSAKAWFSVGRPAWSVQFVRWQPEQGGWLRGWLKAPDADRPHRPATLEAALAAAAAFCQAPDVTLWWENPGAGVY